VVVRDSYYQKSNPPDPFAHASGGVSPARFVKAMAASPLLHDGNIITTGLPYLARKARLYRSMGGLSLLRSTAKHRAA
jgi:hypothetical protein